MRNVSLAVLALFSVLALSQYALSEEYALEYRHITHPNQDGVHGSNAKMEVLARSPKGVDLPAQAGSERVFCKWKTAMAKDGFLYVVFSRSGRYEWHDMILVDANCNGQLSDETPVEAFLTQGKMDYSHYGPIEVRFPAPEGELAYYATFSLYGSSPDGETAWVKSSCWRGSDLTLDGVTYRLAVVDGNVNGVFNDTSMNLDDLDFVAFPSPEGCLHRSIGKYLDVGGKLYLLSVSRDGARIGLVPVPDVSTGNVRTKGYVTTLLVAGECGELCFDLVANKTSVPCGKWAVKAWDYEGDMSQGRVAAAGDYRFGTKTVFDVAAGKEVELDIGAPDKPNFELTKATKLDRLPGGDSYRDASPLQNSFARGGVGRLSRPGVTPGRSGGSGGGSSGGGGGSTGGG